MRGSPQHPPDISCNYHAPVLDLLRQESIPVIHGDIAGLRQVKRQIPEGFLNKHGRHAPHAKLQKENPPVPVLPDIL